jgi:hypothetical protein
MSDITTPAGSGDLGVVTVAGAADLIGRDEKTVRRYLPTAANEAKGQVRLPGAHRDGASPNAPWLIPVHDLVATGLCAAPARRPHCLRPAARRRPRRPLPGSGTSENAPGVVGPLGPSRSPGRGRR